jgi:uncharacterized protein YfaS (alpha-2-macroglobulin family)
MTVAVTNILSAGPMSGVDLELLDYQKQVIFKTTSDGDGMATFSLKRKPYLLVAKKGNERGYLNWTMAVRSHYPALMWAASRCKTDLKALFTASVVYGAPAIRYL